MCYGLPFFPPFPPFSPDCHSLRWASPYHLWSPAHLSSDRSVHVPHGPLSPRSHPLQGLGDHVPGRLWASVLLSLLFLLLQIQASLPQGNFPDMTPLFRGTPVTRSSVKAEVWLLCSVLLPREEDGGRQVLSTYLLNRTHDGTGRDLCEGWCGGDLCFELCKTTGVSGSLKKGSLFPGTVQGRFLKPSGVEERCGLWDVAGGRWDPRPMPKI